MRTLPVLASYSFETTAASSPMGLRAAPPVRPECASLPPVRSSRRAGLRPRRLYGAAGLPDDSQMGADTREEAVLRGGRLPLMNSSKWGLAVSPSSSQRKRMFSLTPFSEAHLAANRAVMPGPLSSVEPRP